MEGAESDTRRRSHKEQDAAAEADREDRRAREAEEGTMPLTAGIDEDEAHTTRRGRIEKRLRSIYNADPLLVLTILGVCFGIFFGLILQAALPEEPENRDLAVRIVGFPGQVLLNLLKMMVLPLIGGSMIGGVCALQDSGAATGKLARRTLLYFSGTTVIAVFLGLIFVQIIRPGSGGLNLDQAVDSSQEEAAQREKQSLAETIIDVILKMFPPNIVKAAVDMNVLGIITFSLFFGAMLSSLGTQAQPMIQLVHIFNEVIMKMVMAILWLAPFGIACLISSQIAASSNLGAILQALAKYVATVCLCLGIHGGMILPGIFWAVTKKNPWTYMRGMTQALATAFGTDSSSATLPVTMLCCERNNGVSPLISKFVLPLAATVNMNGTALYEALTVIFIAQLHGIEMGVGQLLVVAFTSTLAAVGAAAIPSAGLVTMVMVLQSVNLDEYVADLSIIFTIDWALDRLRTTVNVLGDAYGAGIVQHLCGEYVAAASHTGGSEDALQGSQDGVQGPDDSESRV